MNAPMSTCSVIDALLSDYFEGTLDAGDRTRVERHLSVCRRCARLVSELEGITQAARALPPLEVPRDLWPAVAARIQAPVVAMRPAMTARDRWTRLAAHWRAAAAAVVLVAGTAGTTYVIAHQPAPAHRVLAAAPSAAGPHTATPPATDRPRRTPSAAKATTFAARVPGERAYDAQIADLERVLRDRQSRLDPATVAVIRKNLAIIDSAIAQSRTALERDPASDFLGEELQTALGRKVELLRTAAFIPSHS